jgi:hypothetical protein
MIPLISTGKEESKQEPDNDTEAVEAIYSAVISDPGVPQTFEEAFFGPNKEFWRPAIYEVLMSFINRKIFKNKDKQQVQQQLKRKLMTTKRIFKEKISQDDNVVQSQMCLQKIHADTRS